MWMHIIAMETQFHANLVYRVHRSRIAKLYHAGQRSLNITQNSMTAFPTCCIHPDLTVSYSATETTQIYSTEGPLCSCWFVFVSFSKKICSWTIKQVRQNRNDGAILRASRVIVRRGERRSLLLWNLGSRSWAAIVPGHAQKQSRFVWKTASDHGFSFFKKYPLPQRAARTTC